MARDESQRIVIRRKKSGHGGGHHGGSWKIAYADFITAMMAFFLVMWLLSLIPKEDLKGLADYFRTPLSVAIQGGPAVSTQSRPIPGGGKDMTERDGEQTRSDGGQFHGTKEREMRRLQTFRLRLENVIDHSPMLRAYRPQLLIDMTTEGLRVQIVDTNNRPMFATGSAQVAPYMRAILRELGPLLNELPNKISLSGHTDALNYAQGERSYSNWELSADRANASRRELVAGGLSDDKVMRIVGLGANMPLVKNDPYAPVNRRISLVILNESTQKRIEQENQAAADVTSTNPDELQQQLDQMPPPETREFEYQMPVSLQREPASEGSETLPAWARVPSLEEARVETRTDVAHHEDDGAANAEQL